MHAKYKENEKILHAIAAHHGEIECKRLLPALFRQLMQFQQQRPGARRENIENYIKRLQQLEDISTSFDGVEEHTLFRQAVRFE